MEAFEGFYLRAYWNLVTEKRGGIVIPYSEIIEYGERSGLDSTMIEVLIVVIRQLEVRHERWAKGERTRRELVDRPSPAKRQKSMSKRNG